MINPTILSDGCITLRAIEASDVDFVYLAENDAQAWSVAATVAPMSRMLIQQYVEQYTADIYRDRQLRLIVTHCDTGERIGIVDLYDYDPRNSRAGVGIYIVPAYRAQGLGVRSLSVMCQYAQEFLAIHNLYAVVAEDNVASLKIFGKCRFVEVATLSEWVRTAQGYKSAVLLQRIADA